MSAPFSSIDEDGFPWPCHRGDESPGEPGTLGELRLDDGVASPEPVRPPRFPPRGPTSSTRYCDRIAIAGRKIVSVRLANARSKVASETTAQLVWNLGPRLPEPEGEAQTDE